MRWRRLTRNRLSFVALCVILGVTLASLLAGLSSRTMRVRVLRAMTGADALQRTIDQHQGIYAALAAGDPNLAHAMAVQHVITTEAWLRQLLAGDGG